MKKGGQIQISFGMIFSIIIIIATVAVGFYVINYFLDLSKCTKIGSFWDSIDKEVDKAWNGDISQTIFNRELPSGITHFCFGSLNDIQSEDQDTKRIFSELRNYGSLEGNSYIYPPGKACDLAFKNIRHATADKFFCVPVKSGTISVKLSKGSFDALVKLSKP